MKKQNKKYLILLVAGCLFIGATQIINHSLELPDFSYGLLMGIGLGLSLLSGVKSLSTVRVRK